jgi:hypothetical protein
MQRIGYQHGLLLTDPAPVIGHQSSFSDTSSPIRFIVQPQPQTVDSGCRTVSNHHCTTLAIGQ